MNRQLEEDVERAWQSLSPNLRHEIEIEVGRRDDIPTEIFGELVVKYLASRLMEVTSERRVRDAVGKIRDEVRQDTGKFLEDLGQQSIAYFGRIAEAMKERDEKIAYLIQNLASQRALPVKAESPPIPTQDTPKFPYISVPVRMDCEYKKNGPKGCITVEHGPDGTYGVCTKGDQVRRKQILPLLFTTALNTTGCPSNRLIMVCEYLKNQRVKLS